VPETEDRAGQKQGRRARERENVSKQSYEEKKVSSETEEKKRHWITLRIKLERQWKRKRRKRNKQVLGMGMGLGVEIQTEVPVRTSIGAGMVSRRITQSGCEVLGRLLAGELASGRGAVGEQEQRGTLTARYS
jgi:hypothetical protein